MQLQVQETLDCCSDVCVNLKVHFIATGETHKILGPTLNWFTSRASARLWLRCLVKGIKITTDSVHNNDRWTCDTGSRSNSGHHTDFLKKRGIEEEDIDTSKRGPVNIILRPIFLTAINDVLLQQICWWNNRHNWITVILVVPE